MDQQQPRFTTVRLREGYDMGEVDAFVGQALASYAAGALRPEEVASVQFSPVRFREGYEMGEVDDWLDRLQDSVGGVAVTHGAHGESAAPERLGDQLPAWLKVAGYAVVGLVLAYFASR